MKRAIIIAACALAGLGYTKLIWQSGFDAGADVGLCVAASMIENGGKLASDHASCKAAQAYKRNPLWQLRRRNASEEG